MSTEREFLRISEMGRKTWLKDRSRKLKLKCKICGGEWEPRKTRNPKTCPLCNSYRWKRGPVYQAIDNIKPTLIDLEPFYEKEYIPVYKPNHKKMINKISKIHRLVKESISVKEKEGVFVYMAKHIVFGLASEKEGRVFLPEED